MTLRRPAHILALITLFPVVLLPSLFAQARATALLSAPAIATHTAVFVERMQADATRRLEPADRLDRGDRVITRVN